MSPSPSSAFRGVISITFLTLCTPQSVNAALHQNKTINQIQADSRACAFFNLNGVPEADSVVPGQAWLAISTSAPNYQTMLSLIMSAKLAGKTVDLTTDGTTSCGYATAAMIAIN
jgi:hypothetical protein